MPAYESADDLKKFIYNPGYETTIEYIRGEQVQVENPDIRLVVHPALIPYIPVELVGNNMSDHIQSVAIKKDRHTAAGSFVVTMDGKDSSYEEIFTKYLDVYPIKDLLSVLDYNLDLIFKEPTMGLLWVNGYHKMTGFLKSFKKVMSAGGEEQYIAEFDELSALYLNEIMDTVTYIDASNQKKEISSVTKVFDESVLKVGLPPEIAISEYMSAFLSQHLAYGYGAYSFSFSDRKLLPLRLINASPPFGGIAEYSYVTQWYGLGSMITNGGSSFWDWLKSNYTSTFIEMWCESGGRTRCIQKSTSPATLAYVSAILNVSTATRGSSLKETNSLLGAATAALNFGNVSVTIPGTVNTIVRSTPYDNPILGQVLFDSVVSIFGLSILDLLLAGDYVVITDDDIMSKSIGSSDVQQNTVWRVNMNGGGTASSQNSLFASFNWGPLIPIFPGGIGSFGFKQHIVSLTMISDAWVGASEELKNKNTKVLFANAYTELMKIWFRNQTKFLEGTFTTRPKPYARPGDLLLYLPRAKDGLARDKYQVGVYYIDSMDENYGIDGNTTTFSVIRGTPLPWNLSQIALLLLDWDIVSSLYPSVSDKVG